MQEICIHTYIYICTYTSVCVYIYINIHIHVHVFLCKTIRAKSFPQIAIAAECGTAENLHSWGGVDDKLEVAKLRSLVQRTVLATRAECPMLAEAGKKRRITKKLFRKLQTGFAACRD